MIVNVELPETLRMKLESRAAESGHATVEQYIQALIRSDTDGFDYGAPDRVRVDSDEQLKSLLDDRIDNGEPTIEASPKFWKQLRERI